jgi:hypothetical protein
MNRKIFIILTIMVSALTFFTLFPNYVQAQDDEISALRQKISELENRIKDLESLLIIYKEPEEIRSETVQGWQNKKNWRNLKAGMTAEQVRAVLGEPTKVIDGTRTLWYYPNIFCGYVSFDDKGRLAIWNEP